MYFEPVYLKWFFKLTGISSLDWRSKWSLVNFIWNLIFLSVLITVGVYAVIMDYLSTFHCNSIRMKTRTAIVVTFLEIFLNITVLTTGIIGAAVNYKSLTKIKSTISDVDEQLGSFETEEKLFSSYHTKFSIAVIYVMLHHTVLVFIDVQFWFHLTTDSRLYAICYLYLSIEIAIEIHFALLAWNVKYAFVRINQGLTEMLEYYTDERNSNWQYDFLFQLKAVSRTKKHHLTTCMFQGLHWALCNAIQLINNTLGWQLLTLTFCICVHIIVTPYFLLLNLFFPAAYGSADVAFLILQVGWVVTHNIHLLVLVIPSSSASSQAKKTAVIICKYFQHQNAINIPSFERKQMEIFVLQLRKYTTQFSACGVFNFKLSMISSVIGTVITYLIILVQFQNSDKIFH